MNSILSNNKILLFFNFSFYLAFTLPLTIIIIIIKTIDKLFNSSRINKCNITENVRSENEKKLSVQNFQFTFKSDFFSILLLQGRNSPFVVDFWFDIKIVQYDSIATANQIQLIQLGQCAMHDTKYPHTDQCWLWFFIAGNYWICALIWNCHCEGKTARIYCICIGWRYDDRL